MNNSIILCNYARIIQNKMKIEQLKKFALLFFLLGTTTIAKSQNTYVVYDEKFVHGSPSGKMGAKNGSGLTINPFFKERPLTGTNCLRVASDSTEDWSGCFFQSSGNWRNDQGKYTDLSAYKYFVFSARSIRNEKIGSIGMGEGEKEGGVSEKDIMLTSEWKRFVFEMTPGKISNVNGLLLVVLGKNKELYLDDVYYVDSTFKPLATDKVYRATPPPLSPTAYYVYSDKIDHGIPNGYNGEKNGVSIKLDPDCRENPFYGNKCMKMTIDDSESWRGFYIFASGEWNVTDAQVKKLPDLSGYDKFVFYARADKKHTLINEIGFGENNERKNADGARTEVRLELGTEWKKYEINIKDMDRQAVNTLLFISPLPGTIYFDEIKFVKSNDK